MYTSKRLENTTALVMFALSGCAGSAHLDPPPPVLPHYRIVATSDGFAIERIETDGSADAPAPLVPLGRTIRLDPALLNPPSSSHFRSTLHAPFVQDGLPGPIGDQHDGHPGPDEHGSPRTGASRTAGEQ
ncbi:hypothetical protein [Novosphingobium naphthalenivorans]|jgi:hypothetical protein|uniref:hypothetical protein n=1 Tax=Novosphingobium naphthalenivorans TaxID=273168 RepID=UPI00082F4D88|nr:hypothetical protein [Novosphingobium naphthalenivorans]